MPNPEDVILPNLLRTGHLPLSSFGLAISQYGVCAILIFLFLPTRVDKYF